MSEAAAFVSNASKGAELGRTITPNEIESSMAPVRTLSHYEVAIGIADKNLVELGLSATKTQGRVSLNDQRGRR